MIIEQVREILADDPVRFAWTGLRQFQNVQYTVGKIEEYHDPPASQKKNVLKQAQQIRYCLAQAEEYFTASSVVSLATKPLLLYYGIMSLALAEILIKQSGDSSLDRARGQHAHHGLDLRVDANPSELHLLSDSASKLRAVPLVRGSGGRFGTFELWHRTSRETPWAGKEQIIHSSGNRQERLALLAKGRDERPDLFPENGFSLLDCLRSIPQLAPLLRDNEISPSTAGGHITSVINAPSELATISVIIHPASAEVLETVYPRFLFPLGDFESVDVVEMPSGCIIQMRYRFGESTYTKRFPFGFQTDWDKIFFSGGQNSLNEFGVIYTALYILGNYARYFPDQWMIDVEQCSLLSLAALELMELATRRAPLLSLCEMTQTWHLVPGGRF